MRSLAFALSLALVTAACGAIPQTTPQDARNALAAGANGLEAVAPVVEALCAAGNKHCDALRADLVASRGALEALQSALDAGGDLAAGASHLGRALRALLIELQAAKLEQP